MIKRSISSLCALILFAFLLFPFANAQETVCPTSPSTTLWNGKIFVEGRRAFGVDLDGDADFALCYKGSVYIPVSTIANWLGMQGYYGNYQSITLFTDEKSIVLSWKDQGNYNPNKKSQLEVECGTARERSDITVSLNGEIIQMHSSDGYILYPLEVNNTIYLPIRGICELANFEITWATDAYNEQSIYVRMPLNTEQKHQIKSYLETGNSICAKMEELENELNSNPNISTTQIDAILQKRQLLLNEVDALLQKNSNLPFLEYCNNEIFAIYTTAITYTAPHSLKSAVLEDYAADLAEAIEATRIHIHLELRKLQKACSSDIA